MELSKQASALWAKKRSEDGRQHWLPLIIHLLDTKKTINWLFNNWLSRSQKRLLMSSFSEKEIQNLVKFLGFSHDLGKATAAFQSKKSYEHDDSLDLDLRQRLLRSGFTQIEDLYLASAKESPHALAGEALLEDFGGPASIGAIIGGHHGKPATEAPDEQLDVYSANFWQSDNDPMIQAPWKNVQRELFEYGLAISEYQDAKDIPEVTQPQAVILDGLLIMADWLASSEYLDFQQTKPLFPLISLDQSCHDISLKERFRSALENWSVDDEWEPSRVELDTAYEARWKFKPRSVQRIMSQEISKAIDPGMVIIEAPMGIGKTEIALLAAEQLAYITGSDGLFMGLPTQATSDAMFNRVSEWLAFLAKIQSGNFVIKLMHSKAQFNQKYRELPNASGVYDEYKSGEVVINGWFSGKKSILAKFTVGTIDNLLLMGLKQKHLFLRHLGFSGKVVVVDEVHAYDAYMNQYLYKALEWLGAYHVPVIILSATLPKAKRNELLTSYLKGKYGKTYKKQLKAPEGWSDVQAYPLLSVLDGPEIHQITSFPDAGKQATTSLQVQRLQLLDEEVISHVVDKLQSGGIAGVIVNTVKRAQALAQLVPTDIQLMVLHSAFLAPYRSVQETRLQNAIGKKAHRPAKMIVIGTQVLEQSLDIDFDVLYTDIAPMDLILQRAGRLHRHQVERPQALQVPQVFVMGIEGPNAYGDGNESVYGKYLLMKTDHFLKAEIILPTDISPLVQLVYDPTNDCEVPDITEAQNRFETKLKREERKAHTFQIASPKLKLGKTIHGWLDRNQGNLDQNEQRASAAVRDIRETLEVILIRRTTEGNFLLDGRRMADVAPQVVAQQTIRLPSVVTLGRGRLDQVIKALETVTNRYFLEWQDNIWLKGALALPMDEDLSTVLEGWRLTYSTSLGLTYARED